MVGWAPPKESSDRRGYSTDEESGKKPNLKGYVAKAICTPIQRNNLTYLTSINSKFDSMKNNHFVFEVNMTLVTSFTLSILQCRIQEQSMPSESGKHYERVWREGEVRYYSFFPELCCGYDLGE